MRGEVVFFKDICKKVSYFWLTQNYIIYGKVQENLAPIV